SYYGHVTGDNGSRGDARPHDTEDVRLIEAASALLMAQGIKGTSTEDIAKSAGVTRVTLYRRPGPRAQILREVYAHEAQRPMKTVNARVTPFEALAGDPVRHGADPLYRRLGPRAQILREVYAHEAQRLMKTVNARFTPFESLEWDPVRHVEDLLVGTVFDIRESDLLRRLVLVDRDEAVSTLASQSDS